ncbi:MAG: Crp/Fnr family transcriptional regulator [Candidatus Bipolaricaulia bacterium]
MSRPEGSCDEKEFRIFADLDDEALAELREMVKQINYMSRELIFQEGAPAFGFYLIYRGWVKMIQRSLRGHKQILKILGSGEMLGMTTLFDKESHITHAETLSPVQLGFIERGDFFAFLQKHPPVIFRIFERFSRELKAFQSRLTERSYNGSKGRLARLILKVANSGIELSRTELAELVGVSSKTTIRSLNELEKREFIVIAGRRIEILDEPGLERLAEPFLVDLDSSLII